MIGLKNLGVQLFGHAQQLHRVIEVRIGHPLLAQDSGYASYDDILRFGFFPLRHQRHQLKAVRTAVPKEIKYLNLLARRRLRRNGAVAFGEGAFLRKRKAI